MGGGGVGWGGGGIGWCGAGLCVIWGGLGGQLWEWRGLGGRRWGRLVWRGGVWWFGLGVCGLAGALDAGLRQRAVKGLERLIAWLCRVAAGCAAVSAGRGGRSEVRRAGGVMRIGAQSGVGVAWADAYGRLGAGDMGGVMRMGAQSKRSLGPG